MELGRIQVLPFVVFAQEHDEAFGMAERHRRRDDVEFADETVVSAMVGVQSEREYPAEPASGRASWLAANA